jgi:putative membrane protein insertion efficiency factor
MSPRARVILSAPFIALVYAYRVTLSPLMGGQCRFHPTCSQYALDAYREHGPFRGTYLTIRRVIRCQPFGGKGFDPVPPAPDPAGAPSPGVPRHSRSG